MDKNTGIGLLLIVAILGGYMFWNSQRVAEYNKEQQRINDSIAQVERLKAKDTPIIEDNTANDSIKQQIAISSMGSTLASQLLGSVENKTIENDLLKVTFSNKGGRISSIEFKGYQSYSDFKTATNNSMLFFDEEDSDFSIKFFSKSSDIVTSDFYFTSNDVPAVVTSDSVLIPYRLYADSTGYVEFLYTIYKDSYKIGFDIKFVNMNAHIDPRSSNIDLKWQLNFKQKEKGYTNENNYTTIAYKFPGEKSIEQLSASSKQKSETEPTKVEWINFKQHFFSAILVTGGSINNKLDYQSYDENNPEKLLKTCTAEVQIAYNSNVQTIPLEFYFVPNRFKTLKSYQSSFEKIIPLGGWIIGWINRGIVIPLFDYLSRFISSFGLIIFILTLIIKILISPLTWKSYLSSAKMKVLKPEVDKINQKYPDQKDAMKKQQEVMALYNRTGVSMMGGCLPMLLQMPVWLALFRFFPSSIELRQESFLWADDLSAYDSIINFPFTIPLIGDHLSLFTLLMAVSMFLTSKISMSRQGGMVNDQMKMMNGMMLYVMPLFMFVMFNKFSSGLTYYYFMSNLITIAQNAIISKYFVNEEKLLRQMNERAAKQPKKKRSGFMDNLMKKQQEMLRQQEMQRKQQKNKRKS